MYTRGMGTPSPRWGNPLGAPLGLGSKGLPLVPCTPDRHVARVLGRSDETADPDVLGVVRGKRYEKRAEFFRMGH